MSFFTRLESRIREVDSLLCVGLDPHPGDLPDMTGEIAFNFCLQLIETTNDVAAAYKPNVAFFEALGPDGLATLRDVIQAIPDGIPVLLDAKRGDIASTAEAYATATFNILGADAITINPYLGFDAVEPFIRYPEKGAFLLCKTSNPGAVELQDVLVTPETGDDVEGGSSIPLYVHVAGLATKWNIHDNLGLVVGATQPESLARIRTTAPDMWILAPGVGAQGGDLNSALKSGLRRDGLGILVPVSRGISRAENPRQAALDLRNAINRERLTINSQIISNLRTSDQTRISKIADGLLTAGCIKFGNFTLKSGIESPIYIDLRRLVGYPKLLSGVASEYIQILRNLQFDHLAALPYAGLPITSAISMLSKWTMVYPRKEVKSYGTKAQIEGVFMQGDKVVVIDDLISTGGSKFEGIEKLESAGLMVEDVVVLIDRSQDGAVELANRGYTLHSVLTLAQILDYYEQSERIPINLISATRAFLWP